MNKQIILGALLASVFAMPALAQNAEGQRGGRGEGRARMEAQSPPVVMQAPAGPQVEAAPPQRGDRMRGRGGFGGMEGRTGPQFEARQAQRAERQQQRQQMGAQTRIDPQQRAERQQRREERAANGFPQQRDGTRDWRADRGTFGQRRAETAPVTPTPPVVQRDQRIERNGQRDWRGDGQRGNRRLEQQQRRDVYRNDRVFQNDRVFRDQRVFQNDRIFQDRNTYRGYDNRAYRSYDQRWTGRSWNRDWRRDQRFDWQRYRYSNRDLFRAQRYYAPYGWNYGYRRFSVGLTLSNVLFSQQYWIDDPYSYRLPPAYGPYRWVRYYDDVLLVDLRSGQVVDAIYGFFY